MTPLEIIASIVAMIGVTLVSSKRDIAKYGWWVCLASNVLWFAFGLEIESIPFAMTQLYFLVTSLNGIRNNFNLKAPNILNVPLSKLIRLSVNR